MSECTSPTVISNRTESDVPTIALPSKQVDNKPFGMLIPTEGEKHFSMFSVLRNSHIQQSVSINPRLINRAVDKAIEKNHFDCFDKEPPFNRLCSQQPGMPLPDIDVVRRHCAFGNWALPRLYRELHSEQPIIQLQAINSVCAIVHDPEKTFEAIRLKFVPRLANLLMSSTNTAVQERILLVLQIIAGQAIGRTEIVSRRVLLDGFKDLIAHSSKTVRCKTAAVVEMLARSFTTSLVLLEEEYITVLLQYVTLDDPDVLIFHLETLEKLFHHVQGQEEGLARDALTKMVLLLADKEREVVFRAANCLALLVSHPDGKKISVEKELLVKLAELLYHENHLVYTSAAMVIMFGTHTVKSKHQAAAITGLAERLLELCNDRNVTTQMFAMKALGNMLEHPEIRKTFVKHHMETLQAIRTCDLVPELRNFKETLLRIANWKPWLGYS